MPEPTPPILHRAALERVLQRAAELQAASTEVPETLTEQELVALGAEVGLSAETLKQALLEERMRVVLPEERGLLASTTGPATFVATRVVQGLPREILSKLHEALVKDENLKEQRRFPDRVVWGPRGGFAGAIRELTRLDGRGFPLARADEVNAIAVPADAGRVHIRIEAMLHGRRAGAAKSFGLGVLFGLGIAVVATALNVMLPIGIAVGGGVAAFTGWTARKNYQRDARFAQLAIEQTLDRLEFGEPKKRELFSGL